MPVTITHLFDSPKADGPDTTLVQPSNWNAAHVFSQATQRLLGRVEAGAGPTEEIVLGAGLVLAAGPATINLSAQLQALNGVAANGLLVRTGTGAMAPRTLVGTVDQGIQITNADGVSGNPAFSMVSPILAVWITGTVTALAGISPKMLADVIDAKTPAAAAQLTKAQAEDPASTVFGTVSGQWLAQAIAEQDWGYESAETAIPGASSSVNFAHGLGQIPTRWRVVLRCKTAESGYAVGDEIQMPQVNYVGGTQRNAIVAVNATSVTVSTSNSNTYIILPKAGGVVSDLTPANWRIVARASK